MPCGEYATLEQLLHGGEGFTEVFGLFDTWGLIPELTEGLRQGGATEGEGREAEVNVIDGISWIGDEDGREDLLHIRHLSDGADDDRPRAQHLLAVGVLLRHRERILTRRDIDPKGDGQVRSGFDSVIEACIFTLVAARPHPVRTERHAF